MVDPQITQLLENSINTSCKLAVVVTFWQHGPLQATPQEMAARVCRDIWSVETALKELADDGILVKQDKRYHCTPTPDLRAQLQLLCDTYSHPLQRNELQQQLREIERYARYRNTSPFNFDSRVA